MRLLLLAAALFAVGSAPLTSVRIDDGEARATLLILHKLARQQAPRDADWSRLFSTEGYRRLKAREARFHAGFTDAQFKTFVSGPRLIARTGALQKTLDAWTSANLSVMESRARAYLPPGSALRATVYPLIKPRPNSFVFELDTAPAIMLYLNPSVTRAQFANTVSHELFHVGDAQNCPPPAIKAREQSLNQRQKAFLEWLSAFGEGSAVLAAEGGPGTAPHAEDRPRDRAVWNAAMKHFPSDILALQRFFEQIADGTLSGDAVPAKGMTFFGAVQGPWYTVGYKMDVTIERELGRQRLIAALCDKRDYLRAYNKAAAIVNTRAPGALPLWPDRLANFIQPTRNAAP